MALPSSGPLSFQQIETEFGGTDPIGLNEYYAGGGLVPTGTSGTYGPVPTAGQIAVQNFYGTRLRQTITLNISSNTYNYDIYANASASPAYVAGLSDVIVNVDPGVYVGSTSIGAYAMYVPASFNPADTVTINNSGLIYGCGGYGGGGGSTGGGGGPGAGGGNALYVGFATNLNNLNTIAGGGGGGGGGGNVLVSGRAPPRGGTTPRTYYGGGGGGGGQGFNGGGAGGGGGGNAGGAPGGNGDVNSAGGGGGGANGNPGGPGGGLGAYGAAGNPGTYGAGGGGGPGSYIVGNPLVTYISTGTLYGTVS